MCPQQNRRREHKSNMIKGINKWKSLAKHISCECRCKFHDRKCNSTQIRNNDKCQCECKKPIKHRACKEDNAWIPSKCAGVCDKYRKIVNYLKDCECMKSLINDVSVTCDEIVETPKSASINPSDGIISLLLLFNY